MSLLQCQISLAKPEDIDDIKKIWNEIFLDDFSYIQRFLNTIDIKKSCMVLKENESICSILFMLDCFLKTDRTSIDGSYIYAVATKKEKRGNGFMTMLESSAVEYLKSQGKKFLSLVPQTKELFNMYNKIGYQICSYTNHYELSDFKYNSSLLMTECSAKDFLLLRQIYLNQLDTYIDLDFPFYDYRHNEMKVYKINYNKSKYFLAGYLEETTFHVRETSLDLNGLKSALFHINTTCKIEKAVVRNSLINDYEYGMIKFIDINKNISNNIYMNLMLD